MNESFAEHDKVLRDHGFRQLKGHRNPFKKIYAHYQLGHAYVHHDTNGTETNFSFRTHKNPGDLNRHISAEKTVKEGRDTSPYTAFSRAKAAMYSKPKVRSQFRYNVGTGDESGFGVIDGRTGDIVKKHKDFDKAHDHASRLNQVKEDVESDTIALHKTLKTQGFRHTGTLVRNSVIVGSKFTHPRLGDIHVKDGHAHFRGEKHHDPAALKAHIQSKIMDGITRESDRKERDHYRNEEVVQEGLSTKPGLRAHQLMARKKWNDSQLSTTKEKLGDNPAVKKTASRLAGDLMKKLKKEDVGHRRSFRTYVAEAAGPHPSDDAASHIPSQ